VENIWNQTAPGSAAIESCGLCFIDFPFVHTCFLAGRLYRELPRVFGHLFIPFLLIPLVPDALRFPPSLHIGPPFRFLPCFSRTSFLGFGFLRRFYWDFLPDFWPLMLELLCSYLFFCYPPFCCRDLLVFRCLLPLKDLTLNHSACGFSFFFPLDPFPPQTFGSFGFSPTHNFGMFRLYFLPCDSLLVVCGRVDLFSEI